MSWNASVVATDAANVLVKEVSSINARGRSMILSLESDKWETRANTLDNMLPKDVEANAMLVLERVEDDDKSVRCAAVDALLRSPKAIKKYSKFVALKLQNDNRQIQLLALQLLAELDAAELSQYLKKMQRLEDDKDPNIRSAAKRLRIQCEESQAQAEAAAAAKAARQQQKDLLQRQQRLKGRRQTTATTPNKSAPVTYRVGGQLVPANAMLDST